MSAQLPIACTLSSVELDERLAEVAALGRAALLAVERDGARVVLRFRAIPGVRDRLAAVVAAEAECCPFLDLALREDGAELALTIAAPAGAEPLLDGMVAAYSSQ